LALLRAGLAGLRLAGLALVAFLATVLDLAVFLVAISGSLHFRCSSYELLWILLHFLFPVRLCIPMHWATRNYIPGRFQEARYATGFRRARPQESGPEAACSGGAWRGQETVVDEHVAVADFAVERPQGFAATGTEYAEAGVGFEQRAMCCATQQSAFRIHEVIVLPVERHTKMRAAIEPGRDRTGSVAYHDNRAPVHGKAARDTSGDFVQSAELAHAGSGQSLLEVGQQVLCILAADGEAHEGFGDPHRGAPRRAHLPVDGLGDGDGQGTRIAEVARLDDKLHAVEEGEAVHALDEVEAHDGAELAEQARGAFVLRVLFQARIGNAAHARMSLTELRYRQGIVTGAIHTQCQGIGAHRQVMGSLGSQYGAKVAQALLADLRDAPQLGGLRPV